MNTCTPEELKDAITLAEIYAQACAEGTPPFTPQKHAELLARAVVTLHRSMHNGRVAQSGRAPGS